MRIQSSKELNLEAGYDPEYHMRQVPKRMQVLNLKKIEDPIPPNKLTMVQFIQEQKAHDQPERLKYVYNPYEFASKVNSADFLKQYYSKLISLGLVRPKYHGQTNSDAFVKKISQIRCHMESRQQKREKQNKMSRASSAYSINVMEVGSTRPSSPCTTSAQTGKDKDNTFLLGYSYKDRSRLKSGLSSRQSPSSSQQNVYLIQLTQGPASCNSSPSHNKLFLNKKFTKTSRVRKGPILSNQRSGDVETEPQLIKLVSRTQRLL